MSIVLLASSFEEFVREEIGQCADYLTGKYTGFQDNVRHSIRAAYWKGCLESLRFSGSILTVSEPKAPNPVSIGKIRSLLDSARGFVVDDDALQLNRAVFYRHSNNFRPHVVDEVGARLGIKNLIRNAADSGRIKSYFGVSKKNESYEKLKAKLDEFYERRNEIVHSLSGVTGYAVDVILDYIAVFEMTAESIKFVLSKEIAGW
ncbi:HEPN domain-containing protein [Bradyrhizobium sp. SYSU BS000235]|uniref:HEPN domain-containing protein n=1 Tax=Bradyrhizobium sp. SYSU BS000235 TaxID=3411332 RepID=UPI003C752A4A